MLIIILIEKNYLDYAFLMKNNQLIRKYVAILKNYKFLV
jgi:hypothetical protein